MLAPTLLQRHPEVVAEGLTRRGWSPAQVADLLARLRSASKTELAEIALTLPNLPLTEEIDGLAPPSVPLATAREWRGHWRDASRPYVARPHWEIAEALGMLDAVGARAVAGPRFALLRGWGARLERALLQWMLDLHTTQHGYTEIAPPLLATTEALRHTGHLPHFASEMYAVTPVASSLSADEEAARERGQLWLNPTAEVPLVAMHAGALLPERHLPLAEVVGIPSFRREAGSAGRATRGLLRLHQFYKVELAWVTTPDGSDAAYDALTRHAEAVVATLGLRWRTVPLAARDLSFAAARGRDIEVWFPGMGVWVEVASISDCTTFQARRATIRYQPSAGGRPRLVHTLNGSGIAVGRALAAVLEQHQQEAGGIAIPTVLQPYVGGSTEVPSER